MRWPNSSRRTSRKKCHDETVDLLRLHAPVATGCAHPPAVCRREDVDVSAPKFTRAERDGMLAMYKNGDPLKDIAAEYGCNRSYPCLIARRRGDTSRARRPKKAPGITRAEQRVVDILEKGIPIDVNSLADAVGVTPSTLRVLVFRIREKGGPRIDSFHGYVIKLRGQEILPVLQRGETCGKTHLQVD